MTQSLREFGRCLGCAALGVAAILTVVVLFLTTPIGTDVLMRLL